MKTLLLLRHAKSSLDNLTLPDFDRPLNERGRIEAKVIGKFLEEQKVGFDLIVSSPARRTRETVAIVTTTAGLDVELRLDQRIYEAGLGALTELITELGSDKSVVLLVGHNPGMEALVERLTGRAGQMASGTLAKIQIKSDDWTSAFDDLAELEWLVKPNDLRSA